MQKTISIIVPIHNEEKNIPLLKKELDSVISKHPYDFEIILVNDGSSDKSEEVLEDLVRTDKHYKVLEFSRNFGKEAATTAGLHEAKGDAVIIMDADLQHPPSLVPNFIKKWESGFDVVVGLRTKTENKSLSKHLGSIVYYKIINLISSTPMVSGATDFRLLDRKVVDAYKNFTERERITRGLVDWLGFKREYVEFTAPDRVSGEASYSTIKLVKLAISSFISHSLFPLKFAGYLGLFTTIFSGLGGLVIAVEKYYYHDSLRWAISGTAQLAVLMLFFVGIQLSGMGLIALYIGNIHNEVVGRPLYVIRKKINL